MQINTAIRAASIHISLPRQLLNLHRVSAEALYDYKTARPIATMILEVSAHARHINIANTYLPSRQSIQASGPCLAQVD
jgi:hypothetical protein